MTTTVKLVRNTAIVVGAILMPAAVLATELEIPWVFTSGTPIEAAQVNENFQAVADSINSMAPFEGSAGTGREVVLNLEDGPGELYVLFATPAFTPPRQVSCLVSVDTSVVLNQSYESGTSYVHLMSDVDGEEEIAHPTGVQVDTHDDRHFHTSFTRMVSLSANTGVRFGCRYRNYEDLQEVRDVSCNISYMCQ